MESITVNPGAEPSEAEALEALTVAAESAPTTTEEALAARSAPSEDFKLPEGFSSVADLLKAYEELKGSPAETEETGEEVEGDPEETVEVDPEDTTVDEELPEVITEEDVVEATEEEASEEEADQSEGDEGDPLTADEIVGYLTGRFADNEGTLSDEDYQLAEANGYGRDMVDAYIRGQRAAQELADLKINEAAGGKDSLETMLIWARTGLTADEIKEYNAALADNNVDQAVLGVAKLRERYEAANGREPKLLGGKPARVATDTYSSWADVTVAMSDKRYGKDAAYTAQVSAKLGRSNF
ncbi:hypothetical protein [Rhizobium sp. BK376]|uniref:capsid assembly protein n=1 Tax=Rhizobium sp. BK376 TaxID=2512149 RepID=UPI0010514961|nr:hypothetical protein [Rhizobium sp. BK376]TCR92590.1 capsid assembly protein [Rhizobium sp. BK376]